MDVSVSNTPSQSVTSSQSSRTKKVRFLRNGDNKYKGVVITLKSDKCKSLSYLLDDVTKAMMHNVFLPKDGVRSIFTVEGRPVTSVQDLEDGNTYVSSCEGEKFKGIGNEKKQTMKKSLSISCLDAKKLRAHLTESRLITIIRSGRKPRRIFRHLLSKKAAPTFEFVLKSISDKIDLETGAVRKVFNQSGIEITKLEDFFKHHLVFFVFGTEKHSQDDFIIDKNESNQIDLLNTYPGCSKRFAYKTIGTERGDFPPEIALKYHIGEILGEGSYSIVRKCTSKVANKQVPQVYAMKIVDKQKCRGIEALIENEMAILSGLRHPNIIHTILIYSSPAKHYYMMELYSGGDLYTEIKKSPIEENMAKLMIKHIASAIFYLHAFQIVHRDIKPENLLLSRDADNKVMLKLTDFGLAMKVLNPLYHVVGTVDYMAPEILLATGYGLKVDMWSAGVTLFFMLIGNRPFIHDDDKQLKRMIEKGDYTTPSRRWATISDEAKQLIDQLMTVDPKKRLTAEGALNHPWVLS